MPYYIEQDIHKAKVHMCLAHVQSSNHLTGNGCKLSKQSQIASDPITSQSHGQSHRQQTLYVWEDYSQVYHLAHIKMGLVSFPLFTDNIYVQHV